MFDLPLQIWGGIFYLLNKICFSRAERSENKKTRRIWRIRSWVVYLVGLPAWIIVFVSENNWIVAGVESGGAPAMIIGLIIAQSGHGKEPIWLDYIAKIAMISGFVLSIFEFGGITTINQTLELGIAAGFLMGTYMMAKDKIYGYFWLMLGNVSCSALMGIEGFFFLLAQQLISLIFVTDACLVRYKTAAPESSGYASESTKESLNV
ncbi:MAG: hypothetical protein JRE14_12910 [Deltaproteobacteria bacterium]|nr:hypothetical protein [Deltaproteobacteria bacterium]